MSVGGEFQRYLGDCLHQLEGSQEAGAPGLVEILHRARDRADEDLSGAAELVLESADRPSRPLARDAQAAVDDLLSICRIILGR